MKKIYSLAVALCVCGAANAYTWTSGTSGTQAAASTLISNDLAEVKTVYAATLKKVSVTFVSGDKFTGYMQVRAKADPTAETPTGTENSGSTPLVITAKQDAYFTVYYRRQTDDSKTALGTYTSNEGKDLKMIDQTDVSTKLAADFYTCEIEETTGGNAYQYGYAIKSYKLEADKTYTLWARGTTINFYAFDLTTEPVSQTLTVGSTGFATMVAAGNISIPSGVEAYTVKVDATAKTISATRITATDIMAGQTVLVKAAAGKYTFPGSTSTAVSAFSDNDLKGSACAAAVAGANTYVLAAQGDNTVGFQKVTANDSILCGKGYLTLDAAAGANEFIALSFGEATAIESVEAAAKETEEIFFNLGGARAAAPGKGVFIKKGKQVIMK